MKLGGRPPILVKQSFRELCNSMLSGLHPFDDVAIFLLKESVELKR